MFDLTKRPTAGGATVPAIQAPGIRPSAPRIPSPSLLSRLPGDGMLWSASALIVVGLAWAGLTHVEEVASGAGQVVPKETIRHVQNPEGGLVTKVLIEPGQLVQQGQPLMTLSNSDVAKDFQASLTRLPQLDARVARLEAEANGVATIQWPPETAENRLTLAEERDQARRRRDQLAEMLGKNTQTLGARQAELDGVVGRRSSTQQELRLAEETLASRQKGASGEYQTVGRQEVNFAEREVQRQRTQIAGLDGDARRLAKQIDEAKAANREAENRWRSEAGTELLAARSEREQLKEKLRIVQQQMARTMVLAPITGRVKSIEYNEQSVAPGGAPLLDIVPTEKGLLIETWVSPKDVRGLVPGMPAQVRLTACDSSRYGYFKGAIATISPDTFRPPEQSARTTGAATRQTPGHFQVMVEIEKETCGTGQNSFQIQPGMTAETDFIVGERTILSYLTMPLDRGLERAGRER